jgi:hypothetical protein
VGVSPVLWQTERIEKRADLGPGMGWVGYLKYGLLCLGLIINLKLEHEQVADGASHSLEEPLLCFVFPTQAFELKAVPEAYQYRSTSINNPTIRLRGDLIGVAKGPCALLSKSLPVSL